MVDEFVAHTFSNFIRNNELVVDYVHTYYSVLSRDISCLKGEFVSLVCVSLFCKSCISDIGLICWSILAMMAEFEWVSMPVPQGQVWKPICCHLTLDRFSWMFSLNNFACCSGSGPQRACWHGRQDVFGEVWFEGGIFCRGKFEFLGLILFDIGFYFIWLQLAYQWAQATTQNLGAVSRRSVLHGTCGGMSWYFDIPNCWYWPTTSQDFVIFISHRQLPHCQVMMIKLNLVIVQRFWPLLWLHHSAWEGVWVSWQNAWWERSLFQQLPVCI